jgi:hypothetical protein
MLYPWSGGFELLERSADVPAVNYPGSSDSQAATFVRRDAGLERGELVLSGFSTRIRDADG